MVTVAAAAIPGAARLAIKRTSVVVVVVVGKYPIIELRIRVAINYPNILMTRLGVSVGVVMSASATLYVGYAWQICLLYNIWKKLISDFKSGVKLIMNANQHQH